jgi:hypothetical protein
LRAPLPRLRAFNKRLLKKNADDGSEAVVGLAQDTSSIGAELAARIARKARLALSPLSQKLCVE